MLTSDLAERMCERAWIMGPLPVIVLLVLMVAAAGTPIAAGFTLSNSSAVGDEPERPLGGGWQEPAARVGADGTGAAA